MSETLIRATVDGVDTLLTVEELRTALDYTTPLPKPSLDENATFVDEGVLLGGWTITNGAKTQSSSRIRNTKTSAPGAGLSSILSKPVQYPAFGKDFIMYGSVRAKKATGQFSVVWLLSGTKSLSIWLGSADAATATPGAICIRGITGTTINTLQIASGVDYENEDIKFGLHFDTKYNTVNCYFLKDGYPPEFKGRVACDYFQASTIQTVTGSITTAGNWIEHDYLMVCKPNIIGFGDSIEDGRVGFSADPSLSALNPLSSWRAYTNLLPTLRNRIVVNKGVPGNTSTQMLARIQSDVIDQQPNCIFLGCSNNDFAASVSFTTRSSNIQTMIDLVKSSGAISVLRNSLYGTSLPVVGGVTITDGSYLTYHKTWWDNYKPLLSGTYLTVDPMVVLKSSLTEYVDSVNTGSDGVHPNVAGYSKMAQAYQGVLE